MGCVTTDREGEETPVERAGSELEGLPGGRPLQAKSRQGLSAHSLAVPGFLTQRLSL